VTYTLPEILTDLCTEDPVDEGVRETVERREALDKHGHRREVRTPWDHLEHVQQVKDDVRTPT